MFLADSIAEICPIWKCGEINKKKMTDDSVLGMFRNKGCVCEYVPDAEVLKHQIW